MTPDIMFVRKKKKERERERENQRKRHNGFKVISEIIPAEMNGWFN